MIHMNGNFMVWFVFFSKYALQLRIDRMPGALLAYHDTADVLSAEYISLSEIQFCVVGNDC